jgi:hypothetical protein
LAEGGVPLARNSLSLDVLLAPSSNCHLLEAGIMAGKIPC